MKTDTSEYPFPLHPGVDLLFCFLFFNPEILLAHSTEIEPMR